MYDPMDDHVTDRDKTCKAALREKKIKKRIKNLFARCK